MRQTAIGQADDAVLTFAALVAALALGWALQQANGYWTPLAGGALVVAFCLPVAALLRPSARVDAAQQRTAARLIGPVLTAALVVQGALLTCFPPAMYLQLTHMEQLWPLHLGVWMLVAWALLAPLPAGQQRWLDGLALLVALSLAHWLVRTSPLPHTDVYEYVQNAPAILLRGENPYASTFQDVYGTGQNAYAQGLVQNGRTTVGFPYLPINLWFLCLGAFLPDARYLLWGCLVATCVLLVRAAPDARRGRLAAAALLLTPRCMMLLEQGFLEPISILLGAATAVAAARGTRATPYLLGALLVTKQTMPFAAAAAWLLPGLGAAPPVHMTIHRPGRARCLFAGKVLLAGSLLTLPLVLWAPARFVDSAILVHFAQIRPPDSLTLATWLARHQFSVPSLAWCGALCAAVSALVAARAPRTAAAFPLGFALCYLSFLLFARQAYINYHHQVLAGLLIGVALADFSPRKASS